jgi:hypothetical protein
MLIEEIAEVCGMPIVEALVSHYGGKRITIPKRKPIEPLRAIGMDEALLRREFGGIAIRIPRRRPIPRSIILSHPEPIKLAIEYNVSTRTINRRIRRTQAA